MNLLIDIGNSRIKWCFYDSVMKEFGLAGAVSHCKSDLQEVFSKQWNSLDRPDRVMISNVAGQHLSESMNAWIEKTWQIKTEYVQTEAVSYGVSNAYSDYSMLGVDRWIAIIAGWQRFSDENKAVCVVDCGTAMTIDGISATGQHLGGFIIPGYTMMQEMLINDTDSIEMPMQESPDITECSINFSNTTEKAVMNGCRLAMIAMIDSVVTSMQNDYGKQVNCIITGGNAELIIDQLAKKFEYEPNLILHGLAVLLEKYQ